MSLTEEKALIFEKLPVKKAVLKQIIPSVAAQMVVLIYSLADMYFVGLLNDPIQTASVTVVSSVFIMLTAISNLFGVGGASLIAGALGVGKEEKAKTISAVAFWGAIGTSFIYSLLFLCFYDPLLRLVGATDETIATSFAYAKWVIVIGGPATVANTALATLVRSEGNSVSAAAGVALGGIMNIILDPIFTLPQFLGLKAEGAGIATAISNLAAAVYFLVYLYIMKKRCVVNISPKHIKEFSQNIKQIVRIGLPSFIQLTFTVIAVAAQSKFVSEYTSEAVAALGITKKLDMLPLDFSLGVSNGLLPLIAYNYAAGNEKRRHDCFMFGTAISGGFALLCVIGYEVFAPLLTGIFIDDPVTIQYSATFLRIMVIAMPMMAVCLPMITQFQAMGKVKESLICSILRKGSLDIPLLFLFDAIIPLYGCMIVQPVVDTVSLAAALIFYRAYLKKSKKEQAKTIEAGEQKAENADDELLKEKEHE